MLYFHVTNEDNARAIEAEGFMGSWGDCGYGVYLWTSPYAAEEWAANPVGASDDLSDPVILVVDADPDDLEYPELHPSWDPDDYAEVMWHPMDEYDEAERWQPVVRRLA